MESRKTISKKPSVLEEENKSKEEINLTLQDRIDNTDWCKCGCECKLITTFTKSFCLLLRLKSRAQGEYLTIQLLWATARLLVTRVSLIYLVN